jgi:hypothetical protein
MQGCPFMNSKKSTYIQPCKSKPKLYNCYDKQKYCNITKFDKCNSKDIYDNLEKEYYYLKEKFSYNGCVFKLCNNDFKQGTYIIDKPGLYCLTEDIIFNPNPDLLDGERYDCNPPSTTTGTTDREADIECKDVNLIRNDWKPVLDKCDENYQEKYDKFSFRLGFFAALCVTCDHVIIDLGNFTIRQHEAHALQQRFFSVIELSSSPFESGIGPTNFGEIIHANHVFIENGTIGLSSHTGIHGNSNSNILLRNLKITNFEFSGILLNGCNKLAVKNVDIFTNRPEMPVVGTYSQARFILDFLEKSIKRLNILSKIDENNCKIPYERCVNEDETAQPLSIINGFQELLDCTCNLKKCLNTICECLNGLDNLCPSMPLKLCPDHINELKKICKLLNKLKCYHNAIKCFVEYKLNEDWLSTIGSSSPTPIDTETLYNLIKQITEELTEYINNSCELLDKIFCDDSIIKAKDDLCSLLDNLYGYFETFFNNEIIPPTYYKIIRDQIHKYEYYNDLQKTLKIYGQLKCAMWDTYNKIIVDDDQKNVHPLFKNTNGLPDGNVYGLSIKPKGPAVGPFVSSMDEGVVNNVHIEDVHVSNLIGDIQEIVGLRRCDQNQTDNVYAASQTGPLGDVFQILNKLTSDKFQNYIGCEEYDLGCECSMEDLLQHLNLTIEEENCDLDTIVVNDDILTIDQNVNNPLAEAQLCITFIKFKDGGFKDEYGGTSIEYEVLDWAWGNKEITLPEITVTCPGSNDQINELFPSIPYNFACNGDSMNHVNKGILGFKLDGICNLYFKNCSVKDIVNEGPLGSDVCGKYKYSHLQQKQIGYNGTTVRGVSLSACNTVIMKYINIENLWSHNGLTYGIHMHNNCKDLCIDNICIDKLQSGLKYCFKITNDGELKNLSDNCKLYGEDLYKITSINLLECGEECTNDSDDQLICWLGKGFCQEKLTKYSKDIEKKAILAKDIYKQKGSLNYSLIENGYINVTINMFTNELCIELESKITCPPTSQISIIDEQFLNIVFECENSENDFNVSFYISDVDGDGKIDNIPKILLTKKQLCLLLDGNYTVTLKNCDEVLCSYPIECNNSSLLEDLYTPYSTDLPNHVPTAYGVKADEGTECIDLKCIKVDELCSLGEAIKVALPSVNYSLF